MPTSHSAGSPLWAVWRLAALPASSSAVPVTVSLYSLMVSLPRRALVAAALQPLVKEYMIAAHASVEVGQQVAWRFLEQTPLLDLRLRLGEGTGAVLAMHLVEAALRVYNDMATFDEAGVSDRDS